MKTRLSASLWASVGRKSLHLEARDRIEAKNHSQLPVCKKTLTAIIFYTTFEGEEIIVGLKMLIARIYSEDWEVASRLKPFGVTRDDLMKIVQSVVAARADAVDDDPLTASGQFAYIYGTRALRAVFRQKKYTVARDQNVEAVRHPSLSLKIVYQSVDVAASEFHSPRAISGKGSGADRMIDSAQGSLFSRAALEAANVVNVKEVHSGVWFFCVSVDGDDVRAELSLPVSIKGGNFGGFIERIFIVGPGEWGGKKATLDDDIVEFEPLVTRRL